LLAVIKTMLFRMWFKRTFCSIDQLTQITGSTAVATDSTAKTAGLQQKDSVRCVDTIIKQKWLSLDREQS
jgi:hypothetical protein